MVSGTAVMGKATESLGDSFTTFTANLTQAQIDNFHAADDPHTLANDLLGTATTRIIYDVQQFSSSRAAAPNDPTKWLPAYVATLSRETHVSDLFPGQTSKIQIAFSYSDGFGREIQKKVQAEAGPVVANGPIIDPRWTGSGWTIFNNKGKPVRQYEPFFSKLSGKGHQFEFGAQIGVSSIVCYDPAERVVATLHPNHTYQKVGFCPWHQETWDVNDTVLQTDPSGDPDVGGFFRLLPSAEYTPTWYIQRASGALGPQEQDAAAKTAAHANTPTVAYFDALGRLFLTVADNAAAGKYPSRTEFDIQGNQRSVRDPIGQAGDQQGRVVMRYGYDMLKSRIYQASMEAGDRLMLNDVKGKPIRAWDSRGHNFRTAYDVLRRPTGLFVLGTDAVNSDARTMTAEVLYEKTVYGEQQAAALNLNTRIFQHSDSAGVVTSMGHNPVTGQDEGYDYKGNLLRSSRQFAQDHKALPDWAAGPPMLQTDIFVSSTQYDALNRPISTTTPDGSVDHTTYNEANFLETVSVNLRGAATATSFVTNIDYDAKGQRLLIEHGNNTATTYTYDPLTFRLVRLTTTRRLFPLNQQVVQDLSYTYDPIGNITHIQDDADIQNVVFFKNQRIEPSADYTYDAIYRLIQSSGREQLGMSGSGLSPPSPSSYSDAPRTGLISPSDGNAMGIYTEQYQYDAAGNFLQLIHRGANPANPGWTRSYVYNEVSLVEPGKMSNRLTSTAISGSQPLNEPYTYDLHGNIATMPQLQAMLWDFKDQLNMTRRQAINANDQDGTLHQGERTYYVYDTSGHRVRKVTESSIGIVKKERLYLGDFEVYREYDAGGDVALARESLHVMDDKKRIALVETNTVDISAPNGSLPTTTIRYQFDNHLGSAVLELDEHAAVISYEEYYPYGSTSYQAGRTAAEVSLKRYRFTGKERDEETGFTYHGGRYCAAWLGRWASSDPSGAADGLNLYAYVRGNPLTHSDESGTEGENRTTPPRGVKLHIFTQGKKGIPHSGLSKVVRTPGGIPAPRVEPSPQPPPAPPPPSPPPPPGSPPSADGHSGGSADSGGQSHKGTALDAAAAVAGKILNPEAAPSPEGVSGGILGGFGKYASELGQALYAGLAAWSAFQAVKGIWQIGKAAVGAIAGAAKTILGRIAADRMLERELASAEQVLLYDGRKMLVREGLSSYKSTGLGNEADVFGKSDLTKEKDAWYRTFGVQEKPEVIGQQLDSATGEMRDVVVNRGNILKVDPATDGPVLSGIPKSYDPNPTHIADTPEQANAWLRQQGAQAYTSVIQLVRDFVAKRF
jgi:RHS repeat-associated protein